MVNKITLIIEEFVAQNKPFWLVALLKMDDLVDRWTILMSAPWITVETRDAAFKEILAVLKRELTQEELVSIGQLTLAGKGAHIVQELLTKRSGTVIQEKERVNGNLIHYGEILVSEPELDWQEKNLFTEAAAQ